MKSKTKPKTSSHTNPEHHTGTKHANPAPTTRTHSNPEHLSTHHPTSFGSPSSEHTTHESLKTKTCEEVETGGFASFDETMATSTRCTERATEFCNSCSKSLCGIHYDALHRGHDNFSEQSTSHGLSNR